jgi:Transposase DDE domain
MVLFNDTFTNRRPRMARHLRSALAYVKIHIKSHLPADINGLAAETGYTWRERMLSPAVTVWVFMLQILNGNTAITALHRLSGIPMQASSYCAARKRLPLELFARLFDVMSQAAEECMAGVTDVMNSSAQSLLNGRRVLLADATTFSMPDTPALRKHFGYPAGQREGLGFPVGKLIGVLDALTGCVLVAMGVPLFAHEAREMLALHPLLKRGDVLVADRGFCSFVQISLLLEHGVDAVMHLHQRRKTSAMRDWIETWARPVKRPEWMSPALWERIPAKISIRIVRYTVTGRNGRPKQIYVATTLLDKITYPPELIQRIYGHRWNIETCFNQLKTHAKMNTLKCQDVEGVIKELIMFLIVWNLVRMTMAKFAQQMGVSVWRVSFIDTVRELQTSLQGPRPTEVKLLINPDRPGRWEPRKLKRRPKEYDLLTEPRQNLKAKHRAGCG